MVKDVFVLFLMQYVFMKLLVAKSGGNGGFPGFRIPGNTKGIQGIQGIRSESRESREYEIRRFPLEYYKLLKEWFSTVSTD
jgi:hypothetical protein